jgi:hypothetical protein
VAEPTLTTLVERAGADVRYDTLPVEVTKVGDVTRYRARSAEMSQLVSSEYAWALLNGGDPRPRVEIRNGTDAAGLTVKAAQVVVPAGGEVTKTGNDPNSGVTRSVVGYDGDGDRTAAETLARALGIATVEKAAEPVDGIDVTVLLGSDFVPPP